MRTPPLLFVMTLAAAPAFAQTEHSNHGTDGGSNTAAVAHAARAASAIVLDGRISEAAWANAAPAGGFRQQTPDQGAPASEVTQARIIYDDDALYIALTARDASAGSIVAQLARRDQLVYSDWLAVLIDSYHDRRSAYAFAVNAAGVKVDSRITDDSREDLSWDAVWDAAVARDENGWTAELRIPFSQLRFNRMAEGGTWGINFRRTIARRDEISYWAPVPANSQALVSRFGDLSGLPSLSPPQRIEAVPYAVARLTRAPGDAANPYYDSNAWKGAAGGDLKVGVTSALTLNATINPDFGQVEADPSVVNLSAFETFFAERRPFFVEGAELFRVAGPQVFYSRRIGRAPQAGMPGTARFSDAPANATILGAAKLTGRTRSGWSVGLLEAVTAAEEARYIDAGNTEHTRVVEPLTSYTVGRVARDFNRGRSAFGALFTGMHRSLDEPHLLFLRENAFALALDGRHRFANGNYEISGVVTNTLVTGDTAAIARTQRSAGHYFQRTDADHVEYDPHATSMRGSYAQLQVGKVAGGNWRWTANAAVTTPGFEINDVGFNFASDRITQGFSAGYYSNSPTKTFRRWSVSTNEFGTWTTAGERTDYMFALIGDAELHNHWGATVNFMRHTGGRQPDMLRGGPSLINPGSIMISASGYTDRRRKVSLSWSWFQNYETGTDGYTQQVAPQIVVRPGTNFDFSVGPSFSYDLEQSQWVATRTALGTPRYIVGTVEQKSFGLSARLNYTFASNLSLQMYAQPFIASADYDGFKELRNTSAQRVADQFHVFTEGELTRTKLASGATRYGIDANADGAADYSFDDPSFNVKQLRSTSVLRWEYRPGSALFLVWSHDRSGTHADGPFDATRDFQRLLDARGRNVLLVKATYWIGM
jgi:hypothetical protein